MKQASIPSYVASAAVLAAACLAVLCGSPTVLAQGQERSDKGTVFTGETTVVAVEVPVQVVVGDEPVRGLQAKDFHVYDGGTLRPLTGFEVVDQGRSSSEAGRGAGRNAQPPAFAETPPAGRRHFLLLFDLAFTRPGYIARAVDSARKLVASGLQPSDLVAVAIYSDREGVRMPLGFTPDRAQVDRALDVLDALLQGKRPAKDSRAAALKADPLGLTTGGWGVDLAEAGDAQGYRTSAFAEALAAETGAGQFSGFHSIHERSSGAFLERNILAHSADLSEQTIRAQRADQVIDQAEALRELAVQLRAVEGSKHLVLFSQGFDETLFNAFHNDKGAGFNGEGTNGLLERKVSAMITELRRSGWVIEGVDVGGIAGGAAGSDSLGFKNGLALLAHETGGTLVENSNDLAAGLHDVLQRTSVTYLLTFQAADVPLDGSFRPLRVEVDGLPKGAHVVYRTGHYAPRPLGQEKPLAERTEVAARLLGGEESSGLDIAVRATALDYDGALAQVPVLAEVPGNELVGGAPASDGGSIETQIYAYAFGEDGRVADFFARSVKLDGAELSGKSAAQGAKLAGELELAPGTYELRVLVRVPATGRDGMSRITLDVPPAGAGPRLLPPLFVQPAGERWVVASVVPGAATTGAAQAYPFVVEGKRIAPSAVPVLERGEVARLLVPGIGLAETGVEIETRIVDEQGRAMKAGSLQIVGRRQPEPGQPDLLVGRFDPDGLEPGAYRLEVLLPPDPEGTREVAYAPFRIKG